MIEIGNSGEPEPFVLVNHSQERLVAINGDEKQLPNQGYFIQCPLVGIESQLPSEHPFVKFLTNPAGNRKLGVSLLNAKTALDIAAGFEGDIVSLEQALREQVSKYPKELFGKVGSVAIFGNLADRQFVGYHLDGHLRSTILYEHRMLLNYFGYTYKPEDRSYKPHITTRRVPAGHDAKESVEELKKISPKIIRIILGEPEIKLFESRLK